MAVELVVEDAVKLRVASEEIPWETGRGESGMAMEFVVEGDVELRVALEEIPWETRLCVADAGVKVCELFEVSVKVMKWNKFKLKVNALQ